MATITTTVPFDPDDYLDDATTEALRAEMKRRNRTKDDGIEVWTPAGLADDFRKAFYARDASRFEVLCRVLEKHEAQETIPNKILAFG